MRASLVVQWLRLCAPKAGGKSSILGQETKIRYLACRTAQQKKKKKRMVFQNVLLKCNNTFDLVFGLIFIPLIERRRKWKIKLISQNIHPPSF